MKYTSIVLIILVFFIGCGLMGSSKGEGESSTQIHVPQKISVEIPTILKKSRETNQTEKSKHINWYN